MPRLCYGLVSLREDINRAYPGRSKVSDGWIGDTAHSSRVSDHNPDGHGVVYAIDVTQDDAAHTPTNPNDDVAEAVAEFLRTNRNPAIKYVIWRGRMFSSYATSTTPAWTWRKYTGPNGHFHHVHISLKSGIGDTTITWSFRRPGGVVVTKNWRAIHPGDSDALIAAFGGEGHEVSEVQLILTALASKLNLPALNPGPLDGIYGPRSQEAVSAFKSFCIAMQKLSGQLPWQYTDPIVGTNTIAALRFWNEVK